MVYPGSTARVLVIAALVAAAAGRPHGQLRLLDESDRAAFRSWFVLLADAQFYRPTPDVDDCAALIRHAAREALKPHTPEWVRLARLPLNPAFPDLARPPAPGPSGWPLFRIADGPDAPYAEFADARTIIRYNTLPVSRDVRAARPGDLFYYHQPTQHSPDHLMVFVGRSWFEPEGDDWVVYHTGPSGPHRTSPSGEPPASSEVVDPGEVRKVRLADLARHPSPRWRPEASNPRFMGIFRLAGL